MGSRMYFENRTLGAAVK